MVSMLGIERISTLPGPAALTIAVELEPKDRGLGVLSAMLTIKKIKSEIPIKSIPPLLRFGSSLGRRTIPVSQSIRRVKSPEQTNKAKKPHTSFDRAESPSGLSASVASVAAGELTVWPVGSKSVVSFVESLRTEAAESDSASCWPS